MEKTYPESGPVTLRLNLADSPLVAPLKQRKIASENITLTFDGPKVAHDGFKPMVRDEAFDGGELAIVTYMQARAADLPWTMLPATMVGRFQHHCIGYSSMRGEMKPKDIEGGKVGVRSYSQTTGMWVRGILAHDYDVDLDRVTWCAHDDPHVAQMPDPAFVERFDLAGRKLADMMLQGMFPAAILGNDFPEDARARHLIPDPHKAAEQWYARHHLVPVNHVFVVHTSLIEQRPDIVGELFGMLVASKKASGISGGIDMVPFGITALEKPLDLAGLYATEQKLIPSQVPARQMFDDRTRRLTTA
jgi:4,5-dihydroxyphthalate decarboxylase